MALLNPRHGYLSRAMGHGGSALSRVLTAPGQQLVTVPVAASLIKRLANSAGSVIGSKRSSNVSHGGQSKRSKSARSVSSAPLKVLGSGGGAFGPGSMAMSYMGKRRRGKGRKQKPRRRYKKPRALKADLD